MNDDTQCLLIITLLVIFAMFGLLLNKIVDRMKLTDKELDTEHLKEINYGKCISVCEYDSNETLAKISRAYCVQQCKR